ncbi:MAG: hypothetical protein IKN71_05510 [Alphaproteobacteria bacterium]|nr:hypothetical protein [Alphaproteobacteria bacterium]
MVKNFGFYKENFTDESEAAASISGTRGLRVGGALGHVYAQCIAGSGGFSIAAGKAVTLTGKECDTATGTYAANGVTVVRTFAAAETFAEGDVIAEIHFPSYAKEYGKVDFATNDSGATGAIKIVPNAMG